MMTRTLLVRCAPLAIAASAVLPAIPAVAQDATVAEPVIVLPSDPVVAAPVAPPVAAPAIVLPAPVRAPAVSTFDSSPIEATEPAPVIAKTIPVATAKTVPAVSQTTASPRIEAPVAAALPVVSTEIQAAPAPVTVVRSNSIDEATLAGILGALGLTAVGGVALVASRRRRRALDEAGYEPVAYEPIAPDPVVVATPEQSYAAPACSAPLAPSIATPSAQIANGSDPVTLPEAMPETFEERDALLKELVAADPDRANPFVSTRARARRAKLIMQSLGRSFQNRKPRIDLSEYSHRWPALRGWTPATA